jgi:hypothetical protein
MSRYPEFQSFTKHGSGVFEEFEFVGDGVLRAEVAKILASTCNGSVGAGELSRYATIITISVY